MPPGALIWHWLYLLLAFSAHIITYVLFSWLSALLRKGLCCPCSSLFAVSSGSWHTTWYIICLLDIYLGKLMNKIKPYHPHIRTDKSQVQGRAKDSLSSRGPWRARLLIYLWDLKEYPSMDHCFLINLSLLPQTHSMSVPLCPETGIWWSGFPWLASHELLSRERRLQNQHLLVLAVQASLPEMHPQHCGLHLLWNYIKNSEKLWGYSG